MHASERLRSPFAPPLRLPAVLTEHHPPLPLQLPSGRCLAPRCAPAAAAWAAAAWVAVAMAAATDREADWTVEVCLVAHRVELVVGQVAERVGSGR